MEGGRDCEWCRRYGAWESPVWGAAGEGRGLAAVLQEAVGEMERVQAVLDAECAAADNGVEAVETAARTHRRQEKEKQSLDASIVAAHERVHDLEADLSAQRRLATVCKRTDGTLTRLRQTAHQATSSTSAPRKPPAPTSHGYTRASSTPTLRPETPHGAPPPPGATVTRSSTARGSLPQARSAPKSRAKRGTSKPPVDGGDGGGAESVYDVIAGSRLGPEREQHPLRNLHHHHHEHGTAEAHADAVAQGEADLQEAVCAVESLTAQRAALERACMTTRVRKMEQTRRKKGEQRGGAVDGAAALLPDDAGRLAISEVIAAWTRSDHTGRNPAAVVRQAQECFMNGASDTAGELLQLIETLQQKADGGAAADPRWKVLFSLWFLTDRLLTADDRWCEDPANAAGSEPATSIFREEVQWVAEVGEVRTAADESAEIDAYLATFDDLAPAPARLRAGSSGKSGGFPSSLEGGCPPSRDGGRLGAVRWPSRARQAAAAEAHVQRCVLAAVASLLAEEHEWTRNPRDPAEYDHLALLRVLSAVFVHHALFLPPLTVND
eukprot:gene4823-7445_t